MIYVRVSRREIVLGGAIGVVTPLAGCGWLLNSDVKAGFVKLVNRSPSSHRIEFGPERIYSTSYQGRVIEIDTDSSFQVRLFDEPGSYIVHALVDGENAGEVSVRLNRSSGDGGLDGPGLLLSIHQDETIEFKTDE